MINVINKSLYIFGLIIGFFLINKNNQDLNNLYYLIVYLLFFSSFTIVFLPLIKSNLIGRIPLIYLINLYFLICYIGIFLFDKNLILFDQYTLSEHEKAINILFLGYSFFLIGYLIAKKLLNKFKRKSYKYLDANNKEMFYIGSLILVSTISFFYLIEIQVYFTYLHQIKYPLLLFSVGICFNLILQKNLKYFKICFLIILLFLPIFFEFLSGSFNFPFMMIFLMYVQYVVFKKKINLLPFLIIAFLFLFIHIGKYDYRLLTWDKKNLNLNILDKSRLFFNNYFSNDQVIIIDGNLKTKDSKFENYIENRDNYRLERRIFHSYWSLLIVTKNSPHPVPYWDGYSYKLLFSKIIPRIFWKNKPSDTLGNEFGHRYNILSKDTDVTKRDNSTSWNMPVLNEFYVNFGNSGVIFGMLFIGIFMNFLTKIGSIEKNFNLETIICFYLFIPLFFFESHLSLLFGAIIQSYVFLVIISYCCLYFLRTFFKLK